MFHSFDFVNEYYASQFIEKNPRHTKRNNSILLYRVSLIKVNGVEPIATCNFHNNEIRY